MNNSFVRLIDGMCATLQGEVLTRLDDEFARGQVYGVISLLNTFKARADWSAGFLLQQIEAQRAALDGVAHLLRDVAALPPPPLGPQRAAPVTTPIVELLALRDEGNRSIAAVFEWLDAQGTQLAPQAAAEAARLLRDAMRAEVDIELKNSPRPLFAQMSGARDEEPGSRG